MTRKGDWIQTYSGIHYWPLDPLVTDVSIEDIAHSLSNICRYAGHSSRFYSVAEHSILVSKIVPEEYALQGLLHDATEAYLCDIPRPLKKHITNYNELEDLNWKVIAERFGLPFELHSSVKDADNVILFREMAVLMRGAVPRIDPEIFDRVKVPADAIVVGQYPIWAEAAFLTRFKELT